MAGDPHYRTFDNERFSMQGRCRYKLTENLDLSANGQPYFAVYGKNEHRHGDMSVSYPKYVETSVYGYAVRITTNAAVTVRICTLDLTLLNPLNAGAVVYSGFHFLLAH